MRSCKYLSLLFTILSLHCVTVQSQDTLRVLFLGNSYTSANNLPLLLKNMAAAAGNIMVTDQNVPGGYTTESHLSNAVSLSKIRAGIWNYVVIQEQSQIPTIDHYRYNSMYPSMLQLKDSILLYNPCARIITYMTWGRRFGGQQCDGTGTYCSPAFRDFNHMQDSLRSAYLQISDSMKVQCAPVGIAWQQVLHDTTLVLHQSDNSHPNLSGSYLAACTIFSTITQKQSSGLSYIGGLAAPLAAFLQEKSDHTVFTGMDDWNLSIYQPIAAFSYQVNGKEVDFSNESFSLADTTLNYQWHFGDGSSSNDVSPLHTYSQPGSYVVSLIASNCKLSDTLIKSIVINTANNTYDSEYAIYPNPARDQITISWQTDMPRIISIFNNLGQKVIYHPFDSIRKQVSIHNLANGSYFIRINGVTHVQTVPLEILR